MNDSKEEKKRRRNERRRQRYAEDREFREKENARRCALQRKNKGARNAGLRDKYAADPEFRAIRLTQNAKSQRKADLKRKYGMSLEQYAARLAEQGGVCVICLKPKEKRLCVDHNHEIRKLRSLLCDKCNRGLGYYDEDSAAMRRGADYLDYWQWRHAIPDNAGPRSFALSSLHRLFDPNLPSTNLPSMSLASIQSPPLTGGEDMTPTDESTEDGKASRMMRRAILHELHLPLAPDEPPPIDKLQAVVRAVVNKAAQGDLMAAKEILDRIDGKTTTAAAPASVDIPDDVLFTRRRP